MTLLDASAEALRKTRGAGKDTAGRGSPARSRSSGQSAQLHEKLL